MIPDFSCHEGYAPGQALEDPGVSVLILLCETQRSDPAKSTHTILTGELNDRM